MLAESIEFASLSMGFGLPSPFLPNHKVDTRAVIANAPSKASRHFRESSIPEVGLTIGPRTSADGCLCLARIRTT